MIFQKTIDQVLSGAKTQTSRLWKDDKWLWRPNLLSEEGEFSRHIHDDGLFAVYSKTRWNNGAVSALYRVGKEFSVQPNRGQKGITKIRVLELARRDVRNFDAGDIQREGFKIPFDFYEVWCDMHDAPFTKTLDAESLAGNWITPLWKRPSELYQGLVIRFELLDASPK